MDEWGVSGWGGCSNVSSSECGELIDGSVVPSSSASLVSQKPAAPSASRPQQSASYARPSTAPSAGFGAERPTSAFQGAVGQLLEGCWAVGASHINNPFFSTRTNFTTSFFGYFPRGLDHSGKPLPAGIVTAAAADGTNDTCIATGTIGVGYSSREMCWRVACGPARVCAVLACAVPVRGGGGGCRVVSAWRAAGAARLAARRTRRPAGARPPVWLWVTAARHCPLSRERWTLALET